MILDIVLTDTFTGETVGVFCDLRSKTMVDGFLEVANFQDLSLLGTANDGKTYACDRKALEHLNCKPLTYNEFVFFQNSVLLGMITAGRGLYTMSGTNSVVGMDDPDNRFKVPMKYRG